MLSIIRASWGTPPHRRSGRGSSTAGSSTWREKSGRLRRPSEIWEENREDSAFRPATRGECPVRPSGTNWPHGNRSHRGLLLEHPGEAFVLGVLSPTRIRADGRAVVR